MIRRPRNKAQRTSRLRSHRMNVTRCIGGCDTAVVIRSGGDRRKNIEGLDERRFVGERNKGGIIACRMANDDPSAAGTRQPR